MHNRAPVLNPELNQSKGHDYLPAPQEQLFHRVRRISGEDEGTERDAAQFSQGAFLAHHPYCSLGPLPEQVNAGCGIFGKWKQKIPFGHLRDNGTTHGSITASPVFYLAVLTRDEIAHEVPLLIHVHPYFIRRFCCLFNGENDLGAKSADFVSGEASVDV